MPFEIWDCGEKNLINVVDTREEAIGICGNHNTPKFRYAREQGIPWAYMLDELLHFKEVLT